jgi:hypothetical protein
MQVRLWDTIPAGAIPLALPARSMHAVTIFLAISFVIFAAIQWTAIAGMLSRPVDDVSDLAFLMFQGFWALGWSVGVLLLGSLTVLFAFYSESARIESRTLVHVAKLGPLNILMDYDLAKVRNVRLEPVGNTERDVVRVRFDYGDGANSLGNEMSRAEGQRIVDATATAARFTSSALHTESAPPTPLPRVAPAARPAQPTPESAAHAASALALVAANAVPIAGVLFFEWNLGNVLLLYWVESGVIAFYTVLKIIVVGKLMAVAAVPFFVGHFGGFMAAHFLLLYGLVLRDLSWESMGAADGVRTIFAPLRGSIAALFISHGISFHSNFLGHREYEGATVGRLMTAPYNRIIVMHFTLLFGGWVIMLIGTPAAALAILIALKTLVDLQAHRSEHRR